MFEGCQPTIEFTELMNKVFDILNTHHKCKGLTLESHELYEVINKTIFFLSI